MSKSPVLGSVPSPVKMPPSPSAIQKYRASTMARTSAGLMAGLHNDTNGDEGAGDGERDGDLGSALAGETGQAVHHGDQPARLTIGSREDLRDRVRRPVIGQQQGVAEAGPQHQPEDVRPGSSERS